jgi:LysM repeat protein
VAQGSATGTDRVGLHFAGGIWELLDPITGTRQVMAEPPELYSLLKPGVSTTLRATANFDSQLGILYAWDLVSASRQNVQRLPVTGAPERVAIAPDGISVAYVAEDGAYLWLGQAQRIEGTQVVANDFNAVMVWGPTGWRTPAFTASVAVPTQTAPSTAPITAGSGVTCQGFVASRLVIGQLGRVTTDSDIPNNMRSGAGVNNQQVGQIPAGGSFEVLSGPMCVGDTAWWQVRYRDLTGWTAEGAGSEYWLEPVAPVSSTPGSTGQTYTVQRGDVLARIAQQFNVTVECIIQTNNIPNPNRINAGEVLVIDPAACG